jgi:hypothetical protein
MVAILVSKFIHSTSVQAASKTLRGKKQRLDEMVAALLKRFHVADACATHNYSGILPMVRELVQRN